jgi:hypothetical protein
MERARGRIKASFHLFQQKSTHIFEHLKIHITLLLSASGVIEQKQDYGKHNNTFLLFTLLTETRC